MEILQEMSEYSLDSLESIDSLEQHAPGNNDNDDKRNLKAINSAEKFVRNAPSSLNPTTLKSPRIKDNTTKASGTVRGDRCTSRRGGRNSIIANGRGFARRRRQECRAARDEPWLCIRKRNDDGPVVGERHEEEESNANRRCCTSRPTRSQAARGRRSPRNSSSKCSLRDSGDDMRADKKLGSVLTTWTRGSAASYSELYRRRFNIQRYRSIRSPEGSTLSICGDSQLEQLSLDEGCPSLPDTSRDDGSELSFYRRFVGGHAAHPPRTTRLPEASHSAISPDVVFPGAQCERSVSDGKLKKPTYRPYTIEEYRSLSVPRPDRSLGPDKTEMQEKREWLMRRRSYGDSVSARNRERILQRTRRLKSRRSIAQKCCLSSLKDQDATASKDRENSRSPETDIAMQEDLLKRPVRYPKGRATDDAPSCQKAGTTLEKTASFGSSLVFRRSFPEDSYLETLQQRHLQEKELADRLMRQTLNS